MSKSFMGRRIKTTRQNKHLTGEKLAELCFVNATYLWQIESGRKTPSLPVFISICNALEVSPAYLLADALNYNEWDMYEPFMALWKQASPNQIEVVLAMLYSALKHIH